MAVDPVLSAGLPAPKKKTELIKYPQRNYIHTSAKAWSVLYTPVLTSLPFFGLIGATLGSAASFSLPFLRMGLREGVLLREGRVA